MSDPQSTVEKPADFGTGDAATAQRWISELSVAEKAKAEWERRVTAIIKRYKDERGGSKDEQGRRRFAILWSNIQTLGPAIYARTPTAVVSRRFKDVDPVGRIASEVLERALNYSLEEYDFDATMLLCRQDYLLAAQGQSWVRYVPHMRTVSPDETAEAEDDGTSVTDTQGAEGEAEAQAFEEIEYEEVVCDHVAWNDFLNNPAREWSEVRWVARRVYLTRDELVARFGEQIGNAVSLDWEPRDGAEAKDGDKDEQFKKAQVYEIWDKNSRKALWISKSYNAGPLDVRDDPLGLKGFFPCPKPLYGTQGPDSLVPVPDYVLYQDQAEELDDLTARIGVLTDALRMVGFYAGEDKVEVARVFTPGNENKLIPIDSWAAFAEKGGVRGMIEWVPIDMVIQALQGCFETRARIMEDIYQITGISDILRGATDASETATAQQIKSQWGSLRVRDRQRELARFARDIIQIKGEIIAERFTVDTLQKMTGIKLFGSAMEKQEAQQQLQVQAALAQQAGQQPPPPPPEMVEMLGRPTWEDVMGLLRDNALRSFRIEIETDSTIEPDESEQKQQAVEFVTAIGGLIASAGPIVAQAPPLARLIAESVKFVSRRFRIGREMEETIDQVMDQIGQMPPAPPEGGAAPPDPAVGEANKLKAEADVMNAQTDAQRAQVDAQLGAADLQLRARQQELDAAALARDPNPQVN